MRANFDVRTMRLQSAITAFVEPIVILTILIINACNRGSVARRYAENALEKMVCVSTISVTQCGNLAYVIFRSVNIIRASKQTDRA